MHSSVFPCISNKHQYSEVFVSLSLHWVIQKQVKTTIGGSEIVGRIVLRNITLQQNISRHIFSSRMILTAKMKRKTKPMINLIIRIQDWNIWKPKCFQFGPNPWNEQGSPFPALKWGCHFIMQKACVSLGCLYVCACMLYLHVYSSKCPLKQDSSLLIMQNCLVI